MLFSSVTFLFYFMPLFFLAYYALPGRNTTLLVGSVLFYSWGEPIYIFLLLFYICVNFAFGRLMQAFPARRKQLLVAGIVLNVVLLLYFKYLGFLMSNLAAAAGLVGLHLQRVAPVALPLGISFFTFQGISYLIDLYRGKATVQRSLATFALYKAMFPQLIAGPIVRYTDVSSRLDERNRELHWDQIARGIGVFLIGLSQKVLIANTVARSADDIFNADPQLLTAGTAWLGTLCYTAQIYFDFAGYSDMAIGMGQMLGFTYPENFNLPYISQSITEFWRRWHMSLSAWFRDYLYIPLGGNRLSPARTYLNLLVVFLMCGAWHGASWTFVAWGAYHGAFLIFERAGGQRLLEGAPRPLRHVYTMLAVMGGWVLFRTHSPAHAGAFFRAMVGGGAASDVDLPVARYLTASVATGLVIGAVGAVTRRPSLGRIFGDPREAFDGRARFLRAGFVALVVAGFLLSTLSLASGTYNPFIYFRF